MSFKITGLDKLEKQLKDAQRAFQALDGKITTVHFDPHQPASILAAIGQMENAVDNIADGYRNNPFVQNMSVQLKEAYSEQIHERAAQARTEANSEESIMPTEKVPLLLRQIENIINDLKWAEAGSFDRHIKKLSRILHDPELEPVSAELTEGLQLDAWLAAGEET